MPLESFITSTFEIVRRSLMVMREMTVTVIEARMVMTWVHFVVMTMSWSETRVIDPAHTSCIVADHCGS